LTTVEIHKMLNITISEAIRIRLKKVLMEAIMLLKN